DPDAVRRAAYGTFIANMIAGRLDRVLATGGELLTFAECEDADQTRIVAGRILGSGYASVGNLHLAEDHLSNAMELYQRALTSDPWGDTFAHNPGKTAPAALAHVRWSR